METSKKGGTISMNAILGFAASLILSMGGTIYASSVSVTNQIQTVTEKLRETDVRIAERVSTLEEAVKTIKEDNAETRKDIKDFLKVIKPTYKQ
jgi:hypothetical protein